MKLLIMQFPPASYYFMPLEDKCSPQLPVLKYSQPHVLPLTLREEIYTHINLRAKLQFPGTTFFQLAC
jgi:hypothetical protein